MLRANTVRTALQAAACCPYSPLYPTYRYLWLRSNWENRPLAKLEGPDPAGHHPQADDLKTPPENCRWEPCGLVQMEAGLGDFGFWGSGFRVVLGVSGLRGSGFRAKMLGNC